MAADEVATRCNLNQELIRQVLMKALADCQGQLAERVAVVQRLRQILEDQLHKGVIYPAPMAVLMLRRQTVNEPPPKKQRKWFTSPPSGAS
jgi:hypothetical protein